MASSLGIGILMVQWHLFQLISWLDKYTLLAWASLPFTHLSSINTWDAPLACFSYRKEGECPVPCIWLNSFVFLKSTCQILDQSPNCFAQFWSMYNMDIVHTHEHLNFFTAMCFLHFTSQMVLPSAMSKLFRVLPY